MSYRSDNGASPYGSPASSVNGSTQHPSHNGFKKRPHREWNDSIAYMPGEEVDLDSAMSLPHMPLLVNPHKMVSEHEDSMVGQKLISEKQREAMVEDGLPPAYSQKPDPEPEYNGMDISKDKYSIALLIFLYILQGIPLGLAGSVPYILISRKVTYTDQAIFSFVHWPYSVKLLWAPVVDSLYWRWFGRRKSWLVPMQYISGIFMVFLSYHINYMLGMSKEEIRALNGLPKIEQVHLANSTGSMVAEEHSEIHIYLLTICFFTLYFLAATQDIAVDGWALTMLSRKNVGWASTCNSMGLTAGYFLGYVMFLALESPQFCNNYVRSVKQEYGIITFSGFLYFWGVVFIVTTTLVTIFKKEKNDPRGADSEPEQTVSEMYVLLWKVCKLPTVVSLGVILLTCKVGFAAADAVTGLKLIERGVPRESLALLGIPMVPVQILMPLLISKYTTGPRPMDLYLKAMPYRLLMGIEFMMVTMWAPYTKAENGDIPVSFYFVMFFSYALQQIALYSMFVSSMAFFARVSDPLIGGTYMTLLNTLSNLGSSWPNTIALWAVDPLTIKACSITATPCYTAAQSETCRELGGTCTTSIDGYYIETVVCCILGFLWLMWKTKKVKYLQALPLEDWMSYDKCEKNKRIRDSIINGKKDLNAI